MQAVNQKPIELQPIYLDNIRQDFDPAPIIKHMIAQPLFEPLIQGQPVTITDNKNDPVTDDTIVTQTIGCCDEQFNKTAENYMKQLFGETLINYNKNTNMTIRETFLLQSGLKEKMMEPNPGVVYTPAIDVIPAAKEFIAGQASHHKFFASLGFWARPSTLGVYFINQIAFDQFKDWVAQEMLTFGTIVTPDTAKMMAEFQKIELKELTESLLLRHNDGENCEPCSFARLIVSLIMRYMQTVNTPGNKHADQAGIMAFDLAELISPKTLVFVNVEKHARSNPTAITEEWNMIKNAISQKPKMLSNGQIVKLTTQARNLKKIINRAQTLSNTTQGPMRAANTRLQKSAPTNTDIAKVILKVMNQMAFVNYSMNIYKTAKPTFNKPNRRDPDDFNKQGKTFSTKYKPDLHIYTDTSGSISEENWKDTIITCIAIAKKLNINIYFNSFSDYLSPTTKLKLQGKTTRQIYKQLAQIPKVTGGTSYREIWEFINRSKKRMKELSIIVTDFEYIAPSEYIRHPKNLYYIPCSKKSWSMMQSYGESFCASMLHNDPNFRKHILC